MSLSVFSHEKGSPKDPHIQDMEVPIRMLGGYHSTDWISNGILAGSGDY
jgi:hypothetical protein